MLDHFRIICIGSFGVMLGYISVTLFAGAL